MKVILIKDCKDGKTNQVIEVKDGYAKNFLIKNGFAQPFNPSTNLELSKRKEEIALKDKKKHKEALELKKKIESIILSYSLVVKNDVVHGSISHKPILKDLKANGIDVNRYSLPKHLHIDTTGITTIEISLYKDLKAKLKVEVKGVK